MWMWYAGWMCYKMPWSAALNVENSVLRNSIHYTWSCRYQGADWKAVNARNFSAHVIWTRATFFLCHSDLEQGFKQSWHKCPLNYTFCWLSCPNAKFQDRLLFWKQRDMCVRTCLFIANLLRQQCNYTAVSKCLFIYNLNENYRVLFSLKDQILTHSSKKRKCARTCFQLVGRIKTSSTFQDCIFPKFKITLPTF